ncbi:hypothetical protein GCM10009672_16260 [Nesterenkonia lutea]
MGDGLIETHKVVLVDENLLGEPAEIYECRDRFPLERDARRLTVGAPHKLWIRAHIDVTGHTVRAGAAMGLEACHDVVSHSHSLNVGSDRRDEARDFVT